jgi:DeoR family transcriptional regulator, fructose operon transcriptional repressor
MSPFQQKRRDAILSQVYRHGHVEVGTLSHELGVSEATVRRDLRNLADEGLLDLAHGGASVSRTPDYSFLSRATRDMEAKQTIGRLAAEMVSDGEQIFLDSGTTCFQMTGPLRAKRGISVIVNSIRTAQEFFTPGLDVLLLGGHYRPDRMDAVGPMAAASLDQLRGYRAFFGSDGLGQDFGPTATDIDSASLFGLAVRSSREAILLVDHSKFGAPALYRIVEWKAVSRVVTDLRPAEDWMAFFHQAGIHVTYPEQETPQT